ncbi:hypothetical protein BDQ17DRAFT_1333395 [Cyathus striatus]|nr:hypothetical protein BDQ17DRAFT_1333395 [Cyathus striatus]
MCEAIWLPSLRRFMRLNKMCHTNGQQQKGGNAILYYSTTLYLKPHSRFTDVLRAIFPAWKHNYVSQRNQPDDTTQIATKRPMNFSRLRSGFKSALRHAKPHMFQRINVHQRFPVTGTMTQCWTLDPAPKLQDRMQYQELIRAPLLLPIPLPDAPDGVELSDTAPVASDDDISADTTNSNTLSNVDKDDSGSQIIPTLPLEPNSLSLTIPNVSNETETSFVSLDEIVITEEYNDALARNIPEALNVPQPMAAIRATTREESISSSSQGKHIFGTMTMHQLLDAIYEHGQTLEIIDVEINATHTAEITELEPRLTNESAQLSLPYLKSLKVVSSVRLEPLGPVIFGKYLRTLELDLFNDTFIPSTLAINWRKLQIIKLHCNLYTRNLMNVLKELCPGSSFELIGHILDQANDHLTAIDKQNYILEFQLSTIRVECPKNYLDLMDIIWRSKSITTIELNGNQYIRKTK